MADNRFQYETRPKALLENVVCGANYRFSVLTDRLIRCEFAPNGSFEDRASQTVFFRDFPQVNFTAQSNGQELTIETEHLKLSYQAGAVFSGESLQITMKTEPAAVWHYGECVENLGGTYKTLDGANGVIDLEDGVCSRYGYAVMDDSNTMLLNEEGWVEARQKDTQDLYFFGYGYDYLEAVKAYYRLTGTPPLLPAYALGNWWSRYHAYTQQEYLDLMDRFQKENIPFSVSVVDMDWHITKVPEEHKDNSGNAETWCNLINGWTGYTWNTDYFPDYKAFLKELKARNLKTALNLHPHAGILSHEAQYEEMAKAVGMTPEQGKRVPFDVLSPKFMKAYFDILHHPYEKDGVDFWWMDWQQGTSYWWIHEPNKNGQYKDEREVLDPLWMLNHLHIADISRSGKRPMFFSRFSGPGSHRYPVGFSGDTAITWDSLDFQPYFTATASNVGYSWWSHDIGGHYGGYRDADLALRWLQLGVLSPINRLHSSNNDATRKEPWTYDGETRKIMNRWLRLRHQLFPYLYTMNYRNHSELEPLVQPMYYKYPKCDAAYNAKNQYFFGSELMVAPITSAASEASLMGSTEVFFPQGNWFDFFDGTRYSSSKNRVMKVHRDREHYPVFAKAGGIIPLMTLKEHDNTLTRAENMEVVVFPGASNNFQLYEDVGDYQDYAAGAYAVTPMSLDYTEQKACFVLEKAQGDVSLIPQIRTWKLHFRGFSAGCELAGYVNGKPAEIKPVYHEGTATWTVELTASVSDRITVELTGAVLMTDNGDAVALCCEMLQMAKLSHVRMQQIMQELKNGNYGQVQIDVTSPQEQSIVDALMERLMLLK